MCVIADKLVNQGREMGIEIGMERGKLLMVKALIAEGILKMEDALKILGKTAEELEEEMADACAFEGE